MDTKKMQQLIESENTHLNKLHQIVTDTINEEHLIINNLLNPPCDMLTRGQKISDKVAHFGGSWHFILIFVSGLILWIIYNSWMGVQAFDPYPYILLNLILSCVAALQAPIIMMSQNRQEEKDRMRGENDYLINLKSELEIRSLHQKMDLLLEEQIKTLYETQSVQFEMLKEINDKIDKAHKP